MTLAFPCRTTGEGVEKSMSDDVRPGAKVFDWKLFERLCGLPKIIRNEEIAFIMGVSADTCERQIKSRDNSMTFAEFRKARQGIFKQRILSKQFEVAMAGNPSMLKWLGQNYLEQAEKVETKDTSESKPQRLIIDLSGKSFEQPEREGLPDVDNNAADTRTTIPASADSDRAEVRDSPVGEGLPSS